ncbi:hypothetical protein [Aeromonas hydrophila]|uniref:Phage tail protein n=1 Tax=Aeromonas hydrophila TaxID=644 RepID=A0AAX3PC58_AERHY|nr:hypothetical protein [Aeromonas hydrophila]MDM5119978.1 hypothetical protein [Aeromonas hydrophila]WEE28320.1 hypothetical protein PY771_08380 [Aeromonas hydrophila]
MATTVTFKAQTTENTQVFVNFEQGKALAEITQEIVDVTEVGAVEQSREIKKKGTVAGNEYSVAGKLTNSDIDVKFLLNSDTSALYSTFRSAINDPKKAAVSLKILYPWGETVVGNYAIAKVSMPAATDNPEIVEVTVSLSPSGKIAVTPTK